MGAIDEDKMQKHFRIQKTASVDGVSALMSVVSLMMQRQETAKRILQTTKAKELDLLHQLLESQESKIKLALGL